MPRRSGRDSKASATPNSSNGSPFCESDLHELVALEREMERRSAGQRKPSDYEAQKERARRRQGDVTAKGLEIGPLPAVVNPGRKAECRASLERFCKVYLAGRFPLPWGADHATALTKLQRCGAEGGLFTLAMPRGSGKTSLAEATALWAVLYGTRSFVVLVASTEGLAEEILKSIKIELESNELLAEDFPEVCHPIARLDGNSTRARMQRLDGRRTRIGWIGAELVMPTVPGSAASGSLLRVAGLTGAGLRGPKRTRADGSTIRPDFVIVDDFQTDESARSPVQNATRLRLVTRTIPGMAGPKKKIAIVCPCTVIAPGDAAERLLSHDEHPDWQGERLKLLYEFPANEKLWEQYAEIRRGEDGATRATAFYVKHRAAMDEGAAVAWEDRYNPDQASAVQFAMDLYLTNPASFLAEYQNTPVAAEDGAERGGAVGRRRCWRRSATCRARSCRARRPGSRPSSTSAPTCSGGWSVAWDERFGGERLDWGCVPDQSRAYFAGSDPRPGAGDLPA
jgi:hypothetical protein